MSESLFSSSWYRVAPLKPKLAAHARVHRHQYRGQLWYVLEDPISGRSHRLTPSAYQIVGLLDGQRSVQEIWDAVGLQLGDDVPTQDETIRVLGMLHVADLLQGDVSPDPDLVLRRAEQRAQAETRGRFANPMALKLPLLDPDRWLRRSTPWVRPVFSRWGAGLWCAVVGSALVLAGSHAEELSADAISRLLALENLVVLALVYPAVKLLHELGHAFAARSFGGAVHEVGILFLVLMPLPYVDASSSSVFPDKYQRMLVAGAGILVEVFLAALAFLVWLNTDPGLLRSTAYNVMWIGGVSTLLFNGNPLLRFDGYYVLSDAIEIPNLASRSKQYLGYLTLQHAFDVRGRSPVNAPGEARWFVAYGVAAFVYRLFVMLGIAYFLATQFLILGVMLALFAIVMQVVVPLIKCATFLLTSPRLGERRARALGLSMASAALLSALIFAVPISHTTHAEGVVWPPEGVLVRAGTEGFIIDVLAEPGSTVLRGQALVQIRDPSLEAELAVLRAELRELRARLHSERFRDRVRAAGTSSQIEELEARLARTRERESEVTVRSPGDGTFYLSGADNLTGHYVEQGELLGHVLGLSVPTVRAVVQESRVNLVREQTERIDLLLASELNAALQGDELRVIPAANDRLPSRALGTAGGGRLPVDPTDPDGLRTLDRVFEVEITLPRSLAVREVGTRVYVRFRHGFEPVGARLWRAVRRVLVRDIRV
ncbi:MAG: peptidase M50 [bacterium]|nr:peptidase M50 [bacterium]